MQIVIDIPEVFYEALKKTDKMVSGQRSGKTLMSVICNAVANGVPLPKGHGRLIDADALNISHGVFVPKVKGNVFGCPMDAVFADEINNAPTIIEADVESEDKE